MGKDGSPGYSRSRRSMERKEYRSMTRSPSPSEKSKKSSKKRYSRSSSSSDSANYESRKGRKRDSSPIAVLSSPERDKSLPRSKWLDSSPNFQMQPMTPPSPQNEIASSSAPKPIPSFQREDNYAKAPNANSKFRQSYPDGLNQQYGSNFFPSGSSQFIPPDHHGFNPNNQPSMSAPPPPNIGGPPSNMAAGHQTMGINPLYAAGGPPPQMTGPPPNFSQMPQEMQNSNPNIGGPWDFHFGNPEISQHPQGLPPMGFNRPPSGPQPPNPAPSPHREGSTPNAVEQELVQQKRTLAIQREEYFKKKISLIRDLKSLKDKKRELQKGNSKGSEKLLKENLKLQDEIEQKLKSLDSVIEMLTQIIGDKDEIEQLLKDTTIQENTPKKRKRSRSKSTSRSKSGNKKSSPGRRSTSPHVNIVHYDPELHWCSVCNVFPRSAANYLTHLHSDMHRSKVKEKIEKEKTDDEFCPWRTHEKRERSPPSYKNAPSRRVPIRGVPFLVPATAWYCSVCKTWLGDLDSANRHLRGSKHAESYNVFVMENPHWEVDWLRDRTRAYEKNSESRSKLEESKDTRTSKKEIKPAEVAEFSAADVNKIEERLMALISAKSGGKPAKEESSKMKSRGSSCSSRSNSGSSDDERRKKKKKNKKKKKKRDARDESSDRERGRRGRSSEDDDSGREGRRSKDKKRDDLGRSKEDGKKERERSQSFFRGRGRGGDRGRSGNRGRGGSDRGRVADRGRFDQRRLINRKPLFKPTARDRLQLQIEPPEKLAKGRNVFGIPESEYYGPEVPPKKTN